MPRFKLKNEQLIFILLTTIFLVVPIIFLLTKKNDRTTSNTIEESSSSNSALNPTHVIYIPYKDGLISVRNRPFTGLEYKVANNGSEEGRLLNAQTVLGYLTAGTNVKLLSQQGICYQIQYYAGGKIVEGYIAISVNGKPTLYPLISKN